MTKVIRFVGACGEVIGAMEAGMDVVGVEVDEAQYKASYIYLEKIAQAQHAEIQAVADQTKI